MDLLLALERGHEPELLPLAGIQADFAALLDCGPRVDLYTPNDLSRFLRAEVIEKAAELAALSRAGPTGTGRRP